LIFILPSEKVLDKSDTIIVSISEPINKGKIADLNLHFLLDRFLEGVGDEDHAGGDRDYQAG
jgi:hypothetical protein